MIGSFNKCPESCFNVEEQRRTAFLTFENSVEPGEGGRLVEAGATAASGKVCAGGRSHELSR
jgi:hypothetical protein